jgi:hypothetical protein
MSGADIADKVTKGIARALARTGSAAAPIAYLIRSSGADETVYPPVLGSETRIPCKVLVTSKAQRDFNNTNVSAENLMAMIAPDIAVTPGNNDRLEVYGSVYNIVNVEPYQPGGVVLYYEAEVRRT